MSVFFGVRGPPLRMYYFILKSELKIYITTCSGAEAPTEQHEIFDGICPKPGGAHIHYFTVKKFGSLAIISQNIPEFWFY